MLLAEAAILPGAVDPVDQCARRVVPGACAVAFDGVFEHPALVVWLERSLLQTGMSFFVDADIVLRSKFHRGFGLAPHDGAHMRL